VTVDEEAVRRLNCRAGVGPTVELSSW
jgi:hypothetical protein